MADCLDSSPPLISIQCSFLFAALYEFSGNSWGIGRVFGKTWGLGSLGPQRFLRRNPIVYCLFRIVFVMNFIPHVFENPCGASKRLRQTLQHGEIVVELPKKKPMQNSSVGPVGLSYTHTHQEVKSVSLLWLCTSAC